MASAWQHTREVLALPRTAESLAAATAEGQVFADGRELATKYADQALQRLGVDEGASRVIDAYHLLPISQFLDAPDNKDVRQAWNEAGAALRQAVFDYLRMLEEQLRADDTSVPPPSHQS